MITNLGVFRFRNTPQGSEMVLVKLMPGVSLAEIEQKTDANYTIDLEEYRNDVAS